MASNSIFFFSSRRRHTRCLSDWSSDVCSSDLRVVLRLGRSHDQPRVADADGGPDRQERDSYHPPTVNRSEERRVGKWGRAWMTTPSPKTQKPTSSMSRCPQPLTSRTGTEDDTN